MFATENKEFNERLRFLKELREKYVPKTIKPQDKVLVATGIYGHGFPWIIKECTVLQVTESNIRVEYQDAFSEWISWISPVAILEIL